MGIVTEIQAQLTYAERQAYDAIVTAAHTGLPCPTNLDLEMLTGYCSTSMGPKLVASLERKGFITVIERNQRFRRILVCATGETTAVAPGKKTLARHVPRGAGSASGRLAAKSRRM